MDDYQSFAKPNVGRKTEARLSKFRSLKRIQTVAIQQRLSELEAMKARIEMEGSKERTSQEAVVINGCKRISSTSWSRELARNIAGNVDSWPKSNLCCGLGVFWGYYFEPLEEDKQISTVSKDEELKSSEGKRDSSAPENKHESSRSSKIRESGNILLHKIKIMKEMLKNKLETAKPKNQIVQRTTQSLMDETIAESSLYTPKTIGSSGNSYDVKNEFGLSMHERYQAKENSSNSSDITIFDVQMQNRDRANKLQGNTQRTEHVHSNAAETDDSVTNYIFGPAKNLHVNQP